MFFKDDEGCEYLLWRDERIYLEELYPDANGQPDLPPLISADAMGVSVRTVQKYRALAGGDYHKTRMHIINQKGTIRQPSIRAWVRTVRAWAVRQDFVNVF